MVQENRTGNFSSKCCLDVSLFFT